MLDVLRRHAGSWLIKVALTLIIGSFALFFGYTNRINRYQRDLRAQNLVARVATRPISRIRFSETLEFQKGKMKEAMKDFPKNLEDLIEKSILDQLINQEVSYLFAIDLGLRAPDSAVAREIRKLPPFSPEGLFDSRLYEAHRRSYKFQRGEEFEEALRREITLNRLADLAETCFGPWEEARKEAPSKGEAPETIFPESLMSRWIRKFREKTDIQIYPSPS